MVDDDLDTSEVDLATSEVKVLAPGLAGLLDAQFPRLRVFSYTVETLAPTYRAVMRVFFDAKGRYQIHFRPDQVVAELDRRWREMTLPEGGLERALDQLVEWGNLRRTHDTGRVATLEDFRKRHFLYQLTPAGEAAERSVGAVVDALANSGSLQTVMLGSILRNLVKLEREMRGEAPRPTTIYEALFNVAGQFKALTENASTFMGQLHEAIDTSEVDDTAFRAYKETVIAYLEEFVAELSSMAPQITRTIEEIEILGFPRLAALAAEADQAPALLGEERDVAAELTLKWHGVTAWFVGHHGHKPTVELLRGGARGAINRILMVLERLHEKRFRRLNRTADLLRLAGWFEGYGQAGRAATADHVAAHRLFQSAFALYPARHLGGLEEDPERVTASDSWWDSPPVTVEPALRETGRTSMLGRPPRIVEHGAARRLLEQQHRLQRLETARALECFVGHGPQRLSELPRLDTGELEMLLHLLDQLFAAPPDGRRRRLARSRDGRLRLELEAPINGATLAVVEAEAGSLQLPDFLLTVQDLTAR